ncbi:hypothetical protein ABTJ80_21170, partial [Acinetobacter baumannii]
LSDRRRGGGRRLRQRPRAYSVQGCSDLLVMMRLLFFFCFVPGVDIALPEERLRLDISHRHW